MRVLDLPRVCVIGAGVSGVTACKALSDFGVPHTCFEKSDEVGHNWSPRYPDFPGTFDGPQIHSHDYVDPSNPLDLYGKRVLVVGIGNSAVDIVSELGRKTVADVAFISTRSGAYVVPKYLFGRP